MTSAEMIRTNSTSLIHGFLSRIGVLHTLGCRQAKSGIKGIAERLGYPAGAKLLIIHGDDLAATQSIDRANFAAFRQQAISSASVMVPCQWFPEVAAYAREQPDADLGIHLTLTSQWKNVRWGPVSPKDQVGSLLDPEGYLWADQDLVSRHARPAEVELEIRAQIDRALEAGIRPTHVDSHMNALFMNAALFAVYVKVARGYGLPFLAVRPSNADSAFLSALKDEDIVLDAVVTARLNWRPERWENQYEEILRSLKPGVNELIVHLGYDDAELEAIAVGRPGWDAAWRQRDFNVVTGPRFIRLLKENHVHVVGWRDLEKLLK
jgi:predicted glycoside hydrolase/deacetylase ChbG (UPF0249 family)